MIILIARNFPHSISRWRAGHHLHNLFCHLQQRLAQFWRLMHDEWDIQANQVAGHGWQVAVVCLEQYPGRGRGQSAVRRRNLALHGVEFRLKFNLDLPAIGDGRETLPPI